MANKTEYYIHGVNGPVVKVRGGRTLPRMSLVYVGNQRLFGEVVSSAGEESIVQIYEDSGGLSAGEPVYPTNEPMSVRLGPGLIGGIFDGIGRPLQAIEERAGSFISKGINIESLDEEKLWDVEVLIKEGDELKPGQFFARCRESEMTEHRSMVPPRVSGRAVDVKPSGSYTVVEPIAYVDDGRGNRTPLTLSQRWPVREPRPFTNRRPIDRPLVTGPEGHRHALPRRQGRLRGHTRPLRRGQDRRAAPAGEVVGRRHNRLPRLRRARQRDDPGAGRVPRAQGPADRPPPHGAHHPRREHLQHARGRPRGVHLHGHDHSRILPRHGLPRRADGGLHLPLGGGPARDLRPPGGDARRGELPGLPAQPPRRLLRARRLCGHARRRGGLRHRHRRGLPQGGDFSEPVTQNTQRFVRCFWALDRSLAYARHFPSINWTTSYTEYFNDLIPWYNENFGEDFTQLRVRIMSLLNEESSLMEIVKLIGADILPDDQKLIIETAKVIREGFLQQNAFHPTDTYMKPADQMSMLRVILRLYDRARPWSRPTYLCACSRKRACSPRWSA